MSQPEESPSKDEFLSGGQSGADLVVDTALFQLDGIISQLLAVLEQTDDPEVVRRVRGIMAETSDLIQRLQIASRAMHRVLLSLSA
jgi:hypothetical protein